MKFIKSGYLWLFSVTLAFAFALGFQVGKHRAYAAAPSAIVESSQR